MKHRVWINFLSGLFLFSLTVPLFAQSAEEIMKRIDVKQKSQTSQTRMEMRIYPNGDESDVRSYRIDSYGRGESDSYMVFLEPRSIKGLRILDTGDDIRVYFPSTGRIRRITGDQKGGSVGGIGGDFSYEDIGSGSYTADYTFTIKEETDQSWVIKGVPTDTESSYTHQLFYVDRNTYRVTTVEFFTSQDGHKKSLDLSDYVTSGSIEMATKMVMTNHIDNQRTEVEILAARYNIDIDDKYFNPRRFYR